MRPFEDKDLTRVESCVEQSKAEKAEWRAEKAAAVLAGCLQEARDQDRRC